MDDIRVMTIREPYISWIVSGRPDGRRKTIEVRPKPSPWRCAVGGLVLLHGSASPDGPCAGRIVALAEVLDVRPFAPADVLAACEERYEADQWAVVLGDVVPLARPVRAKGALGLWSLDRLPPSARASLA